MFYREPKFFPSLAYHSKGWKHKILLMLNFVWSLVLNKSIHLQNIQNCMIKYVITRWNRKVKYKIGLKLAAYCDLLFSTVNDVVNFSYWSIFRSRKISTLTLWNRTEGTNTHLQHQLTVSLKSAVHSIQDHTNTKRSVLLVNSILVASLRDR